MFAAAIGKSQCRSKQLYKFLVATYFRTVFIAGEMYVGHLEEIMGDIILSTNKKCLFETYDFVAFVSFLYF